MLKIIYENQLIECRKDENLLDAFFRNKIDVPFSCRNGVCQACIIQANSGNIPTESQKGLSQTLKDSKHFLACCCYPSSDMKLQQPNKDEIYTPAKISSLKQLSKNIMLVSLVIDKEMVAHKTGQFINIRTELDKKIRSYSITNSCDTPGIAIHVQKIKKGTFSSWVFETAVTGDEVQIHYPLGACFASANLSVSGKLLVATGSGLGAIFSIAKEALEKNFTQPVHIHHSSKSKSGLYLQDEIRKLELKYPNFKYFSCVTGKQNVICEKNFNRYDTLLGWEVYLYGNPDMVDFVSNYVKQKGCHQDNVFCDAFKYGENQKYNQSVAESDKMEFIEEEKRVFEPDPKMWHALDKGKKLNKILNDFYDKVLVDSLLAPFFKGVTKEHIVGKQYAFFNQIYTGKDCYFGDRPRNAHHAMIISDSLFDHREKLFADSCIKCQLDEPYLSQILKFDESYRSAMVKTKIWPRITEGEIQAIKGFEEMILDIGSICDGCSSVLEPGDEVHYHNRTGEMFCQECKNNQ